VLEFQETLCISPSLAGIAQPEEEIKSQKETQNPRDNPQEGRITEGHCIAPEGVATKSVVIPVIKPKVEVNSRGRLERRERIRCPVPVLESDPQMRYNLRNRNRIRGTIPEGFTPGEGISESGDSDNPWSLKSKVGTKKKKCLKSASQRVRMLTRRLESRVQEYGNRFNVGGANELAIPGQQIIVGGEIVPVINREGLSEKKVSTKGFGGRTFLSRRDLGQWLIEGYLGVDTMSRFRWLKGRILPGDLTALLWQRVRLERQFMTFMRFLHLANVMTSQPDLQQQQLFNNVCGITSFIQYDTGTVCLPTRVNTSQGGLDWDQVCEFLMEMLGANLCMNILVLPGSVVVKYHMVVRRSTGVDRLGESSFVRARGVGRSSHQA
jgi:hypothetical protein